MRRLVPALFALALVAAAAFDSTGLIDHLRAQIFDRYQQIRPRPYVDAGVRIVDIDDNSLAQLGQWPWPRDLMARLVQRLAEAKVRVIALDVVFAEPDRTSPRDRPSEHDERLAAAIRAAGMVVTGFILTDRETGRRPLIKTGFPSVPREMLEDTPVFRGTINNLAAIELAAAGNGAFSWWLDRDGVIRRAPVLLQLDGLFYPSLSAEVFRIATSARSIRIKAEEDASRLAGVDIGKTVIPANRGGEMELYFTTAMPGRYIPAMKLLDPGFDLGDFAGKIVFIGTSAKGLHDQVLTPLGRLPGVEAHAQAVEQMLLGIRLHRPDWLLGAEATVSLGLCAGLGVLLGFLSTRSSVIAIVAALLAIWAGSWFAFARAGWLLDPVLPTICVASVFVVSMIVERARLERNQGEGPKPQ